jgi:cryptochrome
MCLQGGESQALLRLEDYLADPKWVCGFEKPKTDPSAFVRPATTVLSPYLKFGCLSPRLFHQRLMAVYRGAKGVHSKPPVSLRGQLLWREFFYTVRHWLRIVRVRGGVGRKDYGVGETDVGYAVRWQMSP